MDTRCEGWANYETWCVALWINNEQSSYEYWKGAASHFLGKPDGAERLADALKDEHSYVRRPPVRDDVYGDLLTHSLQLVDWLEVARDILSE